MLLSRLRQHETALVLSLLLLLALGLYWESFRALLGFWLDDGNYTYSHGWLLLLVSIYLVYDRWYSLLQPPLFRPSWLGGLFVLLCSFVWLAATLGSIQVLQFLAITGLVGAIFWGVMGFPQTRIFILPLALMLGALPLWDSIATLLQLPTTLAAEGMLRLSRVPVLREDFFLYVPAGTFEVEAACSGLRYILVASLLGLIFSALHRLNWRVTTVIVFVAAMIAIVSNFIRVYSVIMIGQYTNMESDLIEDHASLGWVIFAVGAIPLFWFASKYASKNRVTLEEEVPKVLRQGAFSRLIGIGSLLIGLLIAPLWLGYLEHQEDRASKEHELFLVSFEGGVQNRRARPIYQPAFIAGDMVREGWVNFKSEVGIEPDVYFYISRFYRQTQDREAVSSSNRLADESKWRQVERGVMPLSDRAGVGAVNFATISSNDNRLRVWQWYQIGDRRIASPLWAKFYNIVAAMQGDSVVDVVVLAAEVDDDIATVDKALHRFAEQI